jgi:hypothetical protein
VTFQPLGADETQADPLLVRTFPLAPTLVTPVPPFATGKVPVTPVVNGRPVALVNVPELGVPSAPPLTTTAPEDPTLTANAVATLVPRPETPVLTGSPVQLDNVPELGVPRTGLVNVGLLRVAPVRVAPDESAFDEIAVAILLNSVSISVPLTIFKGLPDASASLVAKLVLLV